ncbi:MAG: ribonuclease E activity regulator RraA [Gammaproteobacteria bacterium]
MDYATADLYDTHGENLQVAEPIFADFGGRERFHGTIATCKVFEDNSLVRAALEEPGAGRVLVIDGGGSLRCALVGDQLAELAHRNGWAGIVVWGCIRDSGAIARIDIGVKALATNPRKSVKKGEGSRGIPVNFAGVTFATGAWAYADEDGLVVSPAAL